tara:strand:+ start:1016 stop:1228 length:213 start_codon:yes stop_codon:yes gene_type:complete
MKISYHLNIALQLIAENGLTPCPESSWETETEAYAFSVENTGGKSIFGARLTVIVDKMTEKIYVNNKETK